MPEIFPTIKSEGGPHLDNAKREAEKIELLVKASNPVFSFQNLMNAIDDVLISRDREAVGSTISKRAFLSGLGAVGAYIGAANVTGMIGGLKGLNDAVNELNRMEKEGKLSEYTKDENGYQEMFDKYILPNIIIGAPVGPILLFFVRKFGNDKLWEILRQSIPVEYINSVADYPSVRRYVDMAVNEGVDPDKLIRLAIFINVVELEMRGRKPYKEDK